MWFYGIAEANLSFLHWIIREFHNCLFRSSQNVAGLLHCCVLSSCGDLPVGSIFLSAILPDTPKPNTDLTQAQFWALRTWLPFPIFFYLKTFALLQTDSHREQFIAFQKQWLESRGLWGNSGQKPLSWKSTWWIRYPELMEKEEGMRRVWINHLPLSPIIPVHCSQGREAAEPPGMLVEARRKETWFKVIGWAGKMMDSKTPEQWPPVSLRSAPYVGESASEGEGTHKTSP